MSNSNGQNSRRQAQQDDLSNFPFLIFHRMEGCLFAFLPALAQFLKSKPAALFLSELLDLDSQTSHNGLQDKGFFPCHRGTLSGMWWSISDQGKFIKLLVAKRLIRVRKTKKQSPGEQHVKINLGRVCSLVSEIERGEIPT